MACASLGRTIGVSPDRPVWETLHEFDAEHARLAIAPRQHRCVAVAVACRVCLADFHAVATAARPTVGVRSSA